MTYPLLAVSSRTLSVLREREPVYPRHLKRVAIYGPLEVSFSHDEDCDNYSVLKYEINCRHSPPNSVAEEIADAFMKAHKITLKELIEQAPKVQDA